VNINDCRKGDVIGHIKTSKSYEYIGITRCKVDGCWVSMHTYESISGACERFCRFEHDFDGFVLLKYQR
jgi:hypothetical protein